ncbi:FAD-dependent thymidylate synthase [Robertmurraya sp.]|uniref:FAD-dependent thymidylate synthase n=1 Tax=Robertmurraya sp. TaxID=2837525 RepID=UPI0037048692
MSQIKVEYINHCGDDLSVVDAARCSFDKQSSWEYPNQFPEVDYLDPSSRFYRGEIGGFQRLKLSDEKLIKYLANHKHYSPFNHSFISVRVKAPVFVARQLVKHKFMPWNEVSRRYVKGEVEFYTPESWRKAAENVKQGSSKDETINLDIIDTLTNDEGNCIYRPDEVNKAAFETYNTLLDLGVCAEEARMVLPQSMMTTWIWSGTLGAFCDMLVLRLDEHTQYETRVVAQQVAEIVKELFPVSYKALVEK